MVVNWKASEAAHPAREAARNSMNAVTSRDKETWLTLFAEDAVIEDPVGPSYFDPEAKGHHGHEGISQFWDMSIGLAEQIDFTITDSFACGDEVANIGVISTTLPGGASLDAEGVFVYRVNSEGKVASLRAFWEMDRAQATLRQP